MFSCFNNPINFNNNLLIIEFLILYDMRKIIYFSIYLLIEMFTMLYFLPGIHLGIIGLT